MRNPHFKMERRRLRAKTNKTKDRKIQPQISGFFTTKKQDSVPQTADEFYAETSKTQLENIRNADNLNLTAEKCENIPVVENVVCAKMACKTEVSKKKTIQLFITAHLSIFYHFNQLNISLNPFLNFRWICRLNIGGPKPANLKRNMTKQSNCIKYL